MDDNYIKFNGIKWLLEMELVNEPQVINAIKLNVLAISNDIKELEILTVEQNKQMLVLLELSWVGRIFFKERLKARTHDMVQQLLPNFRIRVITDRDLFQKSLDKLRKAVKNVKTNSDDNNNTNQ